MLEGNYQIEVSSAGMKRKIWSAEHFRRFEGEKAKIDLKAPADPKVWIGTIGATVGDESFVLVLDNGDKREICISDIDIARLRMDPWKPRPKQEK
jgi:ribosome maturation factor RimP